MGCCKTGHRFVVLGPAPGQGSGMSAPDIQACLETDSCLLGSCSCSKEGESCPAATRGPAHGPACPMVRCHGQEICARGSQTRCLLASPSLGGGTGRRLIQVLSIFCKVFLIPLNQFCERLISVRFGAIYGCLWIANPRCFPLDEYVAFCVSAPSLGVGISRFQRLVESSV